VKPVAASALLGVAQAATGKSRDGASGTEPLAQKWRSPLRRRKVDRMSQTGSALTPESNRFAHEPGTVPDPSLVTYTHAIYALHAVSVAIGVTSAATIVGSFVFGLPSILAVVMNYARQPEVEGTWLQSHFRWQIRTFWYALLWMFVAGLISAPLVLLLGLGIVTFVLAAMIVGAWVMYRVVRGWLALRAGRSVPI
jgi:uncharacterized membrane protein